MMTDVILNHLQFEGQMVLPLKVMQLWNWLEGSLPAFLVCLDSPDSGTSKLIN